MHAVADYFAVDEDRHMFAQRRLIVQHIASGARIAGEQIVQHLAHAVARGGRRQVTWRWMFCVKATFAIFLTSIVAMNVGV